MNLNPFQAIFPKTEYISSADHFFSTVKEEYPEYMESGFFEKSPKEGLYVYQITQQNRSFLGLIGCVDIEDYNSGRILIHEKTLAAKEQQQIHLLLKRGAQVKPVLLTHPKSNNIDSLLRQQIKKSPPFYEVAFELTEERHSFWEIQDGDLIQRFQSLFNKEVPNAYIADGHHRSSVTALMENRTKSLDDRKSYDQLLCAFFPTTELEILDFNRVIEGLNEVTPTFFMAKLSQLFDIEEMPEPTKPTKKHEITLYINKEWYKLTWRKKVLEAYKDEPVILDVTLLNEKVLNGILNIEDVRMDLRVKYVEGPKGLDGIKDKTLKTEQRIGFCLYPVDMNDFIKLSDAGNTLPPKSTWFEPRIKNGLIVKEF